MESLALVLSCVAFVLALVALAKQKVIVVVRQDTDCSTNDFGDTYHEDEDDPADWWKKGHSQTDEDEEDD